MKIRQIDVINWLEMIDEHPSKIIIDIINGDYTISEMVEDIKIETEEL